MRINIHSGTRQDRHICPDCEHCTYMKGPVESQDKTYCSVTERHTARITDCSSFGERNSREHRFRMFGGHAWAAARDDDGRFFFVPPEMEGNYHRVRAYMKQRGGKIALAESGLTDDE